MLRLRAGFKHLASPKQFTQFLGNGLSQEDRQELAESYNYDYHARKIKFEPHFRSLGWDILTQLDLNKAIFCCR